MTFRSALITAGLLIPGLAMYSAITPAAQDSGITDSAIEPAGAAGFTGLERQLVEEYFGKLPADAKLDVSAEAEGGDIGSPPGMPQGDLPSPDLARNATLPPGLAQRELPADLEEQLPPAPAGYERKIVGDTAVVLIDMASGQVADIIRDVLIPPADD